MNWNSARDFSNLPEKNEIVLVQIKPVINPIPEFTTATYNKAGFVFLRTDNKPLKGQVVAWSRIIPYSGR
ncbi:MAG: hypothetical protein M3Q05_06205 [Bacteroidota bacterium]|nr:hypothetical protein [Bacteroidota bacterium]